MPKSPTAGLELRGTAKRSFSSHSLQLRAHQRERLLGGDGDHVVADAGDGDHVSVREMRGDGELALERVNLVELAVEEEHLVGVAREMGGEIEVPCARWQTARGDRTETPERFVLGGAHPERFLGDGG